jgi:capsular exopolysaccharide synthesis family protein
MSETNEIVVADRMHPVDLVTPDNAPNRESIAVVLRCRWRTMIVVCSLAAAAGLAAVLTSVHPQYRVEAAVHVASVVRPILFKDYDTDISRQYRQFLATVALNIVSPEVVAETLDLPEVRSLPWVLASPDAYHKIVNSIEVKQIGGTELLSVSMIGDSASDMAVIVNKLVDTYLRRREEKRRKWDDKIVASLKREARGLETKLKSRQEQMRQLAEQYGLTVGGDDSDSLLATLITDLQPPLIQAKRDHARVAAGIAALGPEGGVGDVINADPAAFASYQAEDPQLQALKNELRSVELSALSDQRQGHGPDHPDVRAQPELIAALQNRIEKRSEELREVYAASVVRQRQVQLLDAQTTVEFLEGEISKTRQRLAKERAAVGAQKFVLEDLVHERERFEADLNQVRQKIWNIELERNRTARISMASSARAAERPNVDKRPKYAAVAILCSLMLGVGAALLRHNLDTRFRNPRDVTERLGIRVLGSIQRIPDIAVLEAWDDARIVEPIRGISTVLLASADGKTSHVRLITSPTARSGKSSMALNLARSLASTGRRVLLVDADNNGQGATSRLHLSEHAGLRELLEGMCSVEDVVCPTDPAPLQVLPAGQRCDAFSDLLATRQAQETLRALFGKYDEVIVDSAPVLAGSNAVILATLVDDVILVLRAGRSKTEEACAAYQRIVSVGGRVVGVILNGVDERTARYSYNYAYPSDVRNARA